MDISKERWGGEIETQGVCYNTLYKKLGACHWTSPSGLLFPIVRDSSLESNGRVGAEVKTPILTYSQLGEIKPLVEWLKATGCKTTKHCGLHVHVDYISPDKRKLDLQKMPQILNSRLKTYPTPNARYTGTYLPCKSPFAPIKYRRKWACFTDHVQNDKQYSLRKKFINSDYIPQTIEFRIFNAHLDFRYICKCVRFALAIASESRLA